jgi:hypothetical protein
MIDNDGTASIAVYPPQAPQVGLTGCTILPILVISRGAVKKTVVQFAVLSPKPLKSAHYVISGHKSPQPSATRIRGNNLDRVLATNGDDK